MPPHFELLFARPSFLEGIARLFDFGSTMNEYNDSSTPSEADLRALQSDWEAVGIDLSAPLSLDVLRGNLEPPSVS